MNKHYILNLNPQADREWDRCVIRNPITGERPDFNSAIAESVQNKPGSYLVKVSINVEILEQTPTKSTATTTSILKTIPQTSEKLFLMTNE